MPGHHTSNKSIQLSCKKCGCNGRCKRCLLYSKILCLLQSKNPSFNNPVFNELFYILFPIVQNAENILSAPVTNFFIYTRFGQTATVDSPNFDTLYSAALLDFRTVDTITLKVPHIGNDPFGQPRYYSFAFYDINTRIFNYIGKRTVGNPPETLYTIGLDNSNDIVVPSKFVVLIYRLYANIYDTADILIADGLRALTTLTPNSAIAPNNAIPITVVQSKSSPLDVRYFLEQAQRALVFQEKPLLKDIVDRLLENPNRSSVFNALASTFSQSQSRIETIGKSNIEPWVKYASDLRIGDTSPILSFAIVQWNVLYANKSEEAIYYVARFSDIGLPFNGNTEYTMTFSSLPPVDGFWSLTAYSKDGFVPINTSKRYTVGTSSQPIMNEGSNYKIYIGQTNPESPIENNYLQPPAENGIYFILRLYIPLIQTYEPPPIRVDPFP